MNTSSNLIKPSLKSESTLADAKAQLRVLFVSHAYVNGLNQGKLDAIAATQKAKVALVVPTLWKASGWQKVLQLETPYSSLKVYPAKIWLAGRVGAFLYAPWTIWKAIKEFQPDIVHVEQEVFSFSSLELALITKLLNIPVGFFGWENIDRRLPLPRRWIRHVVLNIAQLIVAGNEEGAKLVRQWGYQRTLAVMPQLGVDAALFAPRKRDRAAIFRIGYLGRMLHQKGIETLFSTVNYLNQWGYSIELVLCGSGTDEVALKTEAERQEVSNLIDWRKSVSHAQVPEVLNEFDVLVLPSRTGEVWKEQFGHVLIEAMCMGVPVIGSTCGEIPNVIARDDLVFPEGDALSLANIIQRMILEPDWYEKVSHYGRDRVKKHYTHERIAQRLITLWQQVLEQ